MIPKRKKNVKNKFINKPYQRLILPVVLGLVFVLVISFLAISDWRINKKRSQLRSQVESLQAQLKTLEEKKSMLESGLQQGQSETYVEQQARDKLGLKKPGEEVVSVIPSADNQASSTQDERSLWQKILNTLGF
jgi:cell division protein DivIC